MTAPIHSPARSALALAMAMALTVGMAGLSENAQAQVSRATVRGLVSAPSGVAIGGLAVTATNVATGARYRTSTREDGRYALVGLAPGQYDVSVAGADGKRSSAHRCRSA